MAENNRKHGHALADKCSPEYSVWTAMHTRCSNPNAINYANYGGRGIKVCERWRDFRNFLADMGERPPRGTIERIDSDGDYEPNNCRWATYREQARNRRGLAKLTFNGSTKTTVEWAEEIGMAVSTLWDRINVRGWSVEKALTTPVRGSA